MQTMISAGKNVTDGKRGKTCNWQKGRETLRTPNHDHFCIWLVIKNTTSPSVATAHYTTAFFLSNYWARQMLNQSKNIITMDKNKKPNLLSLLAVPLPSTPSAVSETATLEGSGWLLLGACSVLLPWGRGSTVKRRERNLWSLLKGGLSRDRPFKFLGITLKNGKDPYPDVYNRKFLSASRSSFSLGEGEHQTCATQSAKDNVSNTMNTANSLS